MVILTKSMDNNSNYQKKTLEEKAQKWNAVREQVDKLTDKLGTPVDQEIRELIVGLNILGFPTIMSCFGHIRDDIKHNIKKRVSAPHVMFRIKINEKLEKKHRELVQNYQIVSEKYKEKDITSKPQKDYIKAHEELNKFMEKASLPHNICVKNLIGLLTEFYKGRQVPYGAQLSITGRFESIIIRNLDYHYLYLYDQATKEKKLKECQNEFIAFGEFLKKRYLSEN